MENQSSVRRRNAPITGRRINGRACISCHQRKIKCDILDKGTPCTNCQTHSRPGCCIYQKKKLRSSQNHVRDQRPLRPRPDGASPPAQPVNPRSAHASPETDPQEEENDPGNLAEFIDREDVRIAEIGHRGRMCFIGTEVSNFNYLVRQSSLQPGHEGAFHFGNRQFNRKHTGHDLQHMPPEALERLDKRLEQRLMKAYFEQVNCGWPIVDYELFMLQYEGRIPRLPVQLPLLNAICLVGAHVLAAEDPKLKDLQPLLFWRTKILIDCRFEQDRAVYAQVALLLTWYSDGLEEIVANAWHWIGIATRVALGCGMHRDVTESRMLDTAKRVWTRLFWVIFQFDTLVSASYGRPQTINLLECDVPELNASHFEGIPGAKVDFVIQHSRLCKIISKAMRERWSLQSPPPKRVEATREADAALAQYITQLPPSLQVSWPTLTTWQATLHLTYNHFLILLHRPAPRRGDPDPMAATADPGICGNSALLMTSIVETMLHHNTLTNLWLYSIHSLFTAVIHVGSELSSPNPIVAAQSQRTFDAMSATLRELSKHWRFARGLYCLFEQRASRLKKASAAASPAAERNSGSDDFSLRPAPADTAAAGGNIARSDSVAWSSDSTALHQGPAYLDSNNPTLGVDGMPGSGGMLGGPDRSFQGAFEQNEEMQAGTNLFLDDFSFPDASALDLFLAGMEETNQPFGFEFGM